MQCSLRDRQFFLYFLRRLKYQGNFLVRGGKNIAKEGEVSPRTVIIEFSSFEIAEQFYNSKEYKEAKSILKGKVVRQYQIVEGS